MCKSSILFKLNSDPVKIFRIRIRNPSTCKTEKKLNMENWAGAEATQADQCQQFSTVGFQSLRHPPHNNLS